MVAQAVLVLQGACSQLVVVLQLVVLGHSREAAWVLVLQGTTERQLWLGSWPGVYRPREKLQSLKLSLMPLVGI